MRPNDPFLFDEEGYRKPAYVLWTINRSFRFRDLPLILGMFMTHIHCLE